MAQQNRQAKVLRIGVIQDGQMVDERQIKAGDPVTIGESTKATFVMPKVQLGSSEFTLFKPTPKGYVLQFTGEMSGKISGGTAVTALKKLYDDPSTPKKDGVASLPLGEQDRGKIAIGSVTVLFQFVPPPPPKMTGTPDFRPRMIEEDDPVFLGFLGIWTALGVVLAIWVWVTPPRELTLDDLPERYVKIVVEEQLPEPTPEPADIGKEAKKEAKTETKGEEAMKGAKTDVDRAKAEAQRKAEIMAGSELLMRLIGTKGESRGGVTQDLWGEDEGLGNVDRALSEAAGTTTDGTAALRTGNAGGNAAAEGGDINQIGGGQGGDVSGPKVTVKPRVSAEAGSIDTVAGDDNQVKTTVTRYAGQLQYCYEKVLKVDTSLEGRIEVSWSVGGGVVTGMPVVITNSTNNAELADCVVKKIRRWEFPPDVEGEMSWPFLFQQKK
jgi:hypothetical protein